MLGDRLRSNELYDRNLTHVDSNDIYDRTENTVDDTSTRLDHVLDNCMRVWNVKEERTLGHARASWA